MDQKDKSITIAGDHPIIPFIDSIAAFYNVRPGQVLINLAVRFLLETKAKQEVWPRGNNPWMGEYAFIKNDKGELLTGMELADYVFPFLKERFQEMETWRKFYFENKKEPDKGDKDVREIDFGSVSKVHDELERTIRDR